MGGLFSMFSGGGREGDLQLQYVAVKVKKEETKCSTEEYCKIEAVEIASLDKMLKMDEENTKKFNLTSENFHQTFDTFMEDVGEMLPNKDIPLFHSEKDQIADVFPEGSNNGKESASKVYQKAVDEELEKISKRCAKEYAEAKEAEKNKPPPPDPKKKK